MSSSLAGALNATTPLWTAAIATTVSQERQVTPIRIVGLVLGLFSSLLIRHPWTGSDAGSVGGALACLGAAASYGLSYVYMSRHLTTRGLPPLVLAAGQLTAATGWLILATPFAGLQPVHLSADVAGSVLVLGALGTGAAYILNYRIISDEGSTAASTVTYLLPIVSVALGALVLDEPLTLGGTLVLAGVSLTLRSSTES